MFTRIDDIRFGSTRRVSRSVLTAACVLVVAAILGWGWGGAFAQVGSQQKISQSEGGLSDLLYEGVVFGKATCTIGDLDGDSIEEIAVGVPEDDYGGGNRGAVWILFLNTDGTVRARQKIAAGFGGFRDVLDDGDGFGSAVAGIGDVDGDDVEDLLVGVPYDDDGKTVTGVNRGAVWILFLRSDGTVRDFTKISDKSAAAGPLGGVLQDSDYFGFSACGLGDLDGDTVPDIVVGASGDDFSVLEPNTGLVYVMFLNSNGSVKSYVEIGKSGSIVLDATDYFGSSAAAIGDLDGNGAIDIAVGAPGDDDGASRAGAVWVLFLDNAGGVVGVQKVGATAGNFTGTLDAADEFGTAVTPMGDKDGDGNEDIMVGVPGDDDGGPDRGAAWLLLLGDNGTVTANYKISDTAGDFTGILDDDDHFGAALTQLRYWVGETPHAFLVVGAPNDDDGQGNAGAVWVLELTTLGAVTYTQKVSQTEGQFSALIDDWVRFGISLAPIGDLDDDGVIDMVAGDLDNDENYRGAVWVLFMNTDGTVKAHQKIGSNAGGFSGVLDPMDEFGHAATGVGDLDHDGVEDIAVGAPLGDDGGTDRGAVWILFLNGDGTVKGQQKIADSVGGFESTLTDSGLFGSALTGLGDIDGDERYELAVGAPYDSEVGFRRGAMWILSLNSDGTVDSAQKINDAHGGFSGVLDNEDRFGYSIAGLGDIDGNGVGEVAVGAVSDDDGGTDRGAVWILYLRANRTVRGQTKISSTQGDFAGALGDGDAFGHSVASNGDIDGDGIADLFVGAAYDDDGGPDRGAVWVLLMSPGGTVKAHGKISATEGNFPGPLSDGVLFGASIAPLGDLNNDGVADIALSAIVDNDGGAYAGAVWELFLGAADSDGDGVYYTADGCPAQDASFFDRNGDGCIDQTAGARHIEYWGEGETLSYRIQQDGAPNISDGSDFTAIRQGIDTWALIAGADMNSLYVGTTAIENAVAGDGINLVTFRDLDYDFGTHTLAVGVATSFTEPAWLDGKFYRAGQIIDADLMFNPTKTFTTSGGSGVDLQSVATHEGGHLYGISHSAAKGSVMFYALQKGTSGRVHKLEDVGSFRKAYPEAAWLGTAQKVFGRVVDVDGDPVPGAIVFMTNFNTGDTLGCDFTLPDGSFNFVTMPPVVQVYLSIHAIDGTSAIGYLEPEYVNALVDSTAVTRFPAEYWNTEDSFDEDPALKTRISIPVAGIYGPYEIMTNQDVAGPTVLSHSPAGAAADVGINAAVVVEFSEAIDYKTVKGNFRLWNNMTGTGTGGNAIITSDNHILAFKSTEPLTYETAYNCTLRTGITDLYGNHLGAAYAFQFTTETAPPVALNSLVPNKGVVGSIVVVNGEGFDPTPSGNGVHFTDAVGTGTVAGSVLNASPLQLVVAVPAGAGTGNVKVTVGGFTSNDQAYTLLSSTEVPRGYYIDGVNLGAAPRSIAVLPDGSVAFVATPSGAVSVDVTPGSPTFLQTTPISVTGGLDELDITPDGEWVWAVSQLDSAIYVINAATRVVSDVLDTHARPRGITVGPSGTLAYVSTSSSTIQIWNVEEGSPNYKKQVGALSAPGTSLKSKMAIDPKGEYLLALAGTGALLAFDLGPDTLLANVSLGSDPRDVVVDPTGQRAYVTDGTGVVSIVSLGGFYKVMDVKTSGSLRGAAMTPAGSYIYAANRELNFLDVIDLVETSRTYRSVAATIPQGINPVDVEISADGMYAYSITEQGSKLSVIGIGSGPVIRSLSRHAGPVGTTLVIAGEGFGLYADSLTVNFPVPSGGVFQVTPTDVSERTVVVSVPAGIVSGPISVTRFKASGPSETSNDVYFELLSGTGAGKQLRLVSQSKLQYADLGAVAAVAMSPLGDQLLYGTEDGKVVFIDTDGNSATFNQETGDVSVGLAVHDIVIAPDGKRAYASLPSGTAVYIINSDQASPGYRSVLGTISSGAFPAMSAPRELALSPNGEILLVQDPGRALLYYVDLIAGRPSENQVVLTMPIASAKEIAFTPSGTHAFLALDSEHALAVVDVDSTSGTFWTRVVTYELPPPIIGHVMTPLSVSFFPSGERCVVIGDDEASYDHVEYLFDTSSPADISMRTGTVFGYGPGAPVPATDWERVDVSPQGDRGMFHQNGSGVFSFEVSDTAFGAVEHIGTPFTQQSWMDHDFSIDGSTLYAVGTNGDSLQVYDYYDYATSDSLFKVSGDSQTGVVGETLPGVLRVQVRSGGIGKAGVPVTFAVTNGGGVFPAVNDGTTQVVQTNSGGYAEVTWQLGSLIGTQTVAAKVLGVTGSPMTFVGWGVTDPNSLPLELVDLTPAGGASDVAVTTTVLATFSRAVDPATITTTFFYLHETSGSTPVPGKFGFTDQMRKVSIATTAPLAFSTSYTLEVTGGVEDTNGGALDNPAVATFTTAAAPPLKLVSVSPPAGTVDITVVLSGVSFSSTASQNEVFFNTQKAIPFAGAFDYLKVNVPVGAVAGMVRVYNGADTSNALPFNVLVPANVAADEVVGSITTGSATKCITMNPDGTMAYAVSPESDVIVPIDIVTKMSLQPISVGDYPISIDVHPDGTYAYVPNYSSGTLSIIGTDKNVSAEYHKVVKTLIVGAFPTDVVVSPDGNWVYVVNAGSNFSKNIDIIDSDSQSANYHSVVATVGSAQASRGITINPDGSRLYVGTDDGYVVLNSGDLSYGVVATVSSGTGTRGITINPDGSLLFVLTTDGNVDIYNIVPGSSGENDVVATVQGSSSTRGITLNPDGTILYLIQEENDLIELVGIDIEGAIGVIESGGTVPPFHVVTTPLGSFFAGEDPEAIVFDPTGSGVALVTNSGPATVTFLNTSFVEIELPTEAITIPAFSTRPSVDLEGFEMTNIMGASVSYAYRISTTGPATLSGGMLTSGPAPLGTPNALREVLGASPAAASSYSEIVGVTPTLAPGDSFAPPAAVLNIPAIRQHTEQVVMYRVSIVGNPSLVKEASRLVIIENPVPVFVSGFLAEALDEGVRLTWDVVSDEDVKGFKIYRAETKSDVLEVVSVDGLIPVAQKEWVDESAGPNREYEYTLGVVLSDGGEVLSQTVTVRTMSLVFGLDQNYPNPFNPMTTIEFTLAERGHVTLSVYNVAGQRVATLVDRVISAGRKRLTWDGRTTGGDPVSTGVYFYRLQAGEKTLTKKMMLLR